MINFLLWYFFISLFGLLAFPLAFRLLPSLPDRAYTLTRTLGWLVAGYIFWLLGSLGILQNDTSGVVAALILLGLLSVWALKDGKWGEIIEWFTNHRGLVITSEAVFLVAFAFLAFVRAANPDIVGTEKPMELAFLNAILGSPSFPPHDPWLSGYAISYYYFGYILVSMLIRLSGVVTGVGFNLGVALLFGLTALGAYGVVYNLLAVFHRKSDGEQKVSLGLPILGPFFILINSNIEGLLEIIHARGWFWTQTADGTWASAFWKWLNIQELTQPPSTPFTWLPNRVGGIVWWRASRVLGDYNLSGGFTEVIDEFPFFSYLLADMHPHVLAMPFAILMVGLALQVYLERGKRGFNLAGWQIPLPPATLALSVVLLGGLAFLNTWDFPIYVALVSGAFTLGRTQELGWHWSRLWDFLGLALLLGIMGAILYIPFYIGFASQAGGILPSTIYFTRGVQFWVMFATLLIPIFAFLIFRLARVDHVWDRLKQGILAALLVLGVLWVGMYAFAFLIDQLPGLGSLWLEKLGAPGASIGDVLRASLVGFSTAQNGSLPGRLTAPGAWISLTALIALVVALLVRREPVIPVSDNKAQEMEDDARVTALTQEPDSHMAVGFWLLLVLVAAILVLSPEFFYLLDQFGWRMNTIFKFYYQAWLLWGLAAGFGTAVLLQRVKNGIWAWIWRIVLLVVWVAGLAYPVTMLWIKTNGFSASGGLTLDGNAYLERNYPDQAAAIQWLRAAPAGVIAEASGNSYQDDTNRMATNSGDPDVLGWIQHEYQWGRSGDQIGSRPSDLEQLYRTNNWDEAQAILQKYAIRYVVIGPVERSRYKVNEAKFQRNLVSVFQQGSVTIYEVPVVQPAISTNGPTISNQ